MEIIHANFHILQTNNQVGDYVIIKDPTPEVGNLLLALNRFSYRDDCFTFRFITKPAQEIYGETVASAGWKLTFPEKPQVEKEVEDLLRKWYAKL